MKEIITVLKKKGRKFLYAYILCVGIYYLFDLIYMPWLTYRFGIWMFIPLYPSILLANFFGVYLYDYLGEDVLFLEYGRGWVMKGGGKFERIKSYIRNSSRLIFIALSMYPSPIAGYIYLRKEKKEPATVVLRYIAEGSIYCTALWGGILGLVWILVSTIIS